MNAARRGAVRSADDFRAWAARVPALSGGLAFVGPEPEYGIGLETLLARYGLACIDHAPASALLEARGIPVWTPPRRRPGEPATPLTARSAQAILGEASVAPFLESLSPDGPPAILVFKSSHRLELDCAERGWRLIAPAARVARRWENKVAFRRLAEQLGLPQAPGLIFEPQATSYARLAARLGSAFVVQAPHGYGGAKTWRIDGPEALSAVTAGLRAGRLRATAYVEGMPLTLSACVTARGVAVSAPFCQVTGLASLTRYRLGSCGNDWSSATRLGIDSAPYVALASRIGEALAEEGFRGIFGVDFVTPRSGEPVVIEVNPRLVASVALHAQLELMAGRLPLLARHVMALTEPEADGAPLDLHQAPLQGGQLILHHLGEEARPPARPLATGAYALEAGGAPRFLRPALRVDELAEDEVLLLAPDPERMLASGQAWGRVQCLGPVIDNSGALRPELSALVAWLQTWTGFGPVAPDDFV